jgi:sec-independent protein translocase protein TatC
MARTEAEDGRMTLVEHLTELRTRLFVCVLAVLVCSVVVFIFYPQILDFVAGPYRDVTKDIDRCKPDGCDLTTIDPLAPFLTRIKVATYGGIALSLPITMFQIWRFVTPGLHTQERKYAIPFLLSSWVLFFLGATLSWFTLDKALDFLFTAGGDIEPNIVIDKYLNLVTFMLLAFGAAFQFPVLLVFLLLVRAVKTTQLRKVRRHAAVGIVIVAAVITPSQDPYSLFFLAVPMYLFYEVSIVIGRVMKR